MLNLKKLVISLSLAAFLVASLPSTALANEKGTEDNDDAAIIVDLLVLRPVGLVTTVVGVVVFVPSLLISIPTRSVGKTWHALVVNPAYYTFARELGTEK
jgi:hypothetical protein